MSNCKHCGEINGHVNAIATAHCAYRAATTEDLRRIARDLGVNETAAADLVAHLRARLSDPEAYSTARYVLELGWRPATPSGEQRQKVGICGNRSPEAFGTSEVCTLPHGHPGWHEADADLGLSPMRWSFAPEAGVQRPGSETR